jgi:hypothetical protein
MNKPTGELTSYELIMPNSLPPSGKECFYNKDGKWYYAGIYKAFRLEDLNTREWEALSNEVCALHILHLHRAMEQQLRTLCRPLNYL